MNIFYATDLSDNTIALVNAQVKSWPEGLKRDLEAGKIALTVEKNLEAYQDRFSDTTGVQGFYAPDNRTVYIAETYKLPDGSFAETSPTAMERILNHETGHVIGITLANNIAVSETFARLYQADMYHMHNHHPEIYKNLDGAYSRKTAMHNYDQSQLHEGFAELWASSIAPNDATAFTAETMPRTSAYMQHMIENYQAGRSPDHDLEAAFGITVAPPQTKRLPNGILIPQGGGEVTKGYKLAAIEEQLAAEKISFNRGTSPDAQAATPAQKASPQPAL